MNLFWFIIGFVSCTFALPVIECLRDVIFNLFQWINNAIVLKSAKIQSEINTLVDDEQNEESSSCAIGFHIPSSEEEYGDDE